MWYLTLSLQSFLIFISWAHCTTLTHTHTLYGTLSLICMLGSLTLNTDVPECISSSLSDRVPPHWRKSRKLQRTEEDSCVRRAQTHTRTHTLSNIGATHTESKTSNRPFSDTTLFIFLFFAVLWLFTKYSYFIYLINACNMWCISNVHQ